jgi:hypothetical protein
VRLLTRALPAARCLAALALPAGAAALALAPTMAAAQATEGFIQGRVTDRQGQPVAGATVTARNASTGYQQQRVTDARGRYSFPQLPLGGPYVVSARRLGFQVASRTGIVLNLGDRVPADFTLDQATAQLQEVVVRGDATNQRIERAGASKVVTEENIQQLPITDRSFADLSIIAPTTSRQGTGGIISSSSSIAGGRVTTTDIRVDGVQAKNTLWGAGFGRGPYSFSVEAIREFEIVTNVYDVTQGRQGAGAVNVATQFGTNETRGSLFAYNRGRWGATEDFQRRLNNAGIWQFGGSLGGAIVKDKLHYFVAYDRQETDEPFQTMDIRNEFDERQFGIARDSVRRFVDILQRQYGLAGGQQTGQFDRANALNSVFARLDWAMSENHRLTLRHQFSNWNYDNALTDRFLAVRESFGNQQSRENQLLATLKSNFGRRTTNDLRVAFTDRLLQNVANTRLPRGWVNVASDITGADGRPVRTAQQILQFGGMRTSPELQSERSYQLVNITRMQGERTALTFGTDNSINQLSMFVSIETDGLFQFASLGDLEARRPSSFARLVPQQALEPRMYQWVADASAFAQVEHQLTPNLTATAGLRGDVTAFLTAANRNALVEQRFGRRSDVRPTNFAVQPRAQLTWDVGGRGTDVLRAGGGMFTAQPHYMLQINHLLNDGSQLADLALTRAAGQQIPDPDFTRFRQSFANVPGIPAGAGTRPAFINMFSEDFQVPRTWKGDVAYQKRLFGDQLTLGLTGQYAVTRNLYRYYDLNLREPAFRLANEGNRPVFLPATSISATGGLPFAQARRDPDFARVLELRSDASQHQRAGIAEAFLRLPRGGNLGGSYTYNVTRDNNSYNCCIAVTSLFTPVAGGTQDLAWGYSANDFRHKVVLYGALPAVWGVRLSGRYLAQSGSPVSLVVGRDINGDGFGAGGDFGNNNDLPFIFDPADPNTPQTVRDGLTALLANPHSRAKDAIREHTGRIMSRNAVRNDLFQTLDMRLAKSLPTLRGRTAELSLDVFNAFSLLNREWGGQWQIPAANQVLYTITGFDRATQTYQYRVNPNAGVPVKFGNRYQLQAGMRLGI